MLDLSQFNLAEIKKLPAKEQIAFARAAQMLIKKPSVPRPGFAEFFENTSPYRLEPWQHVIADRYTKLPFQKGQRILMHKPPQFGGSIMTSQRLPPYVIGCNPNMRVRLVTYNETHSERFSSVSIGIMQSKEYWKMFPTAESQIPNNVRVGEWSTQLRESFSDGQASFMALGLRSGFTGSGGDLVIIDDPYKNRDEAFSETINAQIWNWHKETLTGRLNPATNIIVMYHCYNEFDYAAKLKEEGGWEEMRFAAICDSDDDLAGRQIGDTLSPRYPKEYLMVLRDGGTYNGKKYEGMGSAAFESLYQGNPKSRDGSRFKVHMFKEIDQLAASGQDHFFIRYWDIAHSGEPNADRTAGTLLYKHPSGIYTVCDHRAERLIPSKRDDFILNTCSEDAEIWAKIAPVLTYIEQPPGAGVEVIDDIIKYCARYGVRADRVSKDKVMRAMPIIAQMERGNVKFLKKPWLFELKQEMLSFPGGKHDDRVDSLTGAYNVATSLNFL